MRFIFIAVFFITSFQGLAQPVVGKDKGLPTYTAAEGEKLKMNALGPLPPEPPPPQVPISGIEILLGLGAAFGAKRFIASRKKITQ